MNYIEQKPEWELYSKCFPEINKGEENGVAGDKAVWWTCHCLKSKNDIGFYTLYNFTIQSKNQSKNQTVLFNFAVYEQFRGQGYGSIMLKHIINSLKNTTVYLFVKKDNKIAYNLYTKTGFLRSNDYVPPDEFITMSLNRYII